MVFNRNGLPIGQIVLPDRDKGRNLKSTSLAIRPGHRELFIVANSGTEPGGAMIFDRAHSRRHRFPFTSVTGNEWSGRPGNAGPGQGVNSSGSLKVA